MAGILGAATHRCLAGRRNHRCGRFMRRFEVWRSTNGRQCDSKVRHANVLHVLARLLLTCPRARTTMQASHLCPCPCPRPRPCSCCCCCRATDDAASRLGIIIAAPVVWQHCTCASAHWCWQPSYPYVCTGWLRDVASHACPFADPSVVECRDGVQPMDRVTIQGAMFCSSCKCVRTLAGL